MGHFIGHQDRQLYVHDDGVVYSNSAMTLKVADSVEDMEGGSKGQNPDTKPSDIKKAEPEAKKEPGGYICDLCGEEFINSARLKVHKSNKHLGE